MTSGKTIAVNRKARFDYEILETFEAGLVLTGTEIKSIRDGRVNLGQAFAKPEGGELWLHNAHVAEYSHSASNSQDPTRPRKLLLHKNQIRHLSAEVQPEGTHYSSTEAIPEASPGQSRARTGQGAQAI